MDSKFHIKPCAFVSFMLDLRCTEEGALHGMRILLAQLVLYAASHTKQLVEHLELFTQFIGHAPGSGKQPLDGILNGLCGTESGIEEAAARAA